MKILLILLLAINIYAKTSEKEGTAEKVYIANINTMLIFTSEAGLSSGKYRFTKANFKMETYNLPFIYHFKPFYEKMNWFMNGGIGYSITKLDTKTTVNNFGNDITLDHDNKLQTYALGIGGGLRYKSDIGIDYLLGLGIIYSRVGTSITPDDDVSDAIGDFFDKEYNNNYSYRLLLEAQYNGEYKDYKPYIKASYKWYQTESSFSITALSGFSSQSDIMSLETGFETPELFSYQGNNLTLEPYIKLNYLHGDVTSVVKFERFLNTGILAYWNTPNNPSWIERFYVEASTIKAEGLEGYNLGLGFSFDY